jgi:hypothetical protein
MGTMIHLSVSNLDIDWGKNEYFTDHSPLFQKSDVAPVPNWYVVDDEVDNADNWEIHAVYKEGLSAPLHKIVARLNLLGHTLKNAEKNYTYDLNSNWFDDEHDVETYAVHFDDLKYAFSQLDIQTLVHQHDKIIHRTDKIFNDQLLEKISDARGGRPFSKKNYYGDFSSEDGFDPYTFLNLLSLNHSAALLPITWGFEELVDKAI